MFPHPIGSILWAPAAVALLKDAVIIQEIFQYSLEQPALRLEEFQASLTAAPTENRGSVILVQILVDMIGLFTAPPDGVRQTFQRRETITRRFPLSCFHFAPQATRPDTWHADITNFSYFPDLSHETLTLKLSFRLQVCGVKNQLISLNDLYEPTPADQPATAPQVQELKHELRQCQEEITALKRQIQRLKATDAPLEKAAVGKKTAQYRKTHGFASS